MDFEALVKDAAWFGLAVGVLSSQSASGAGVGTLPPNSWVYHCRHRPQSGCFHTHGASPRGRSSHLAKFSSSDGSPFPSVDSLAMNYQRAYAESAESVRLVAEAG